MSEKKAIENFHGCLILFLSHSLIWRAAHFIERQQHNFVIFPTSARVHDQMLSRHWNSDDFVFQASLTECGQACLFLFNSTRCRRASYFITKLASAMGHIYMLCRNLNCTLIMFPKKNASPDAGRNLGALRTQQFGTSWALQRNPPNPPAVERVGLPTRML